MDENLVGYLLKALDPDTNRQVEDYLRENTPAQHKLEQLKQALAPLATDADTIEPPPDLLVRTLARIAEDRCRRLPPAPKPTTVLKHGGGRSWWRRSDLLLAASILLLASLISIPFIGRLRYEEQRFACQNNLTYVYSLLKNHSDMNGGRFPKPEDNAGPRGVAGSFVSALHENGGVDKRRLICPGDPYHPEAKPRSMQELEDIHAQAKGGAAYRDAVVSLTDYAYALGHHVADENGKRHHRHLDRQSGDHIPLLGDQPPFQHGTVYGSLGINSPNHGGQGQNIITVGGKVSFLRDRYVNGGDDVYTNQEMRVAAGLSPQDSVLGASWAIPSPPVEKCPEHKDD